MHAGFLFRAEHPRSTFEESCSFIKLLFLSQQVWSSVEYSMTGIFFHNCYKWNPRDRGCIYPIDLVEIIRTTLNRYLGFIYSGTRKSGEFSRGTCMAHTFSVEALPFPIQFSSETSRHTSYDCLTHLGRVPEQSLFSTPCFLRLSDPHVPTTVSFECLLSQHPDPQQVQIELRLVYTSNHY